MAMANRPSDTRTDAISDPDGSPFRLLGLTPRAAKDGIASAHALACQRQAASEVSLNWALGKILDPEKRLRYELDYPLDATPEQVETFYSTLSNLVSTDALAVSASFPPLSRANFIAESVIRAPLSGNLLIALINAHAAIDPVKIYDVLRSVRQSAGLPAPSLLGVRNGLLELATRHATTLLTAYDLPSAARALSECARRTRAENDPLRVETLSHLLDAYRSLTAAQRKEASHDVEVAYRALGQVTHHDSPADEIARLETSLGCLVTLSEPLALQSGTQDAKISEAVTCIKDLLAQFTERHDYQTAKHVLDAAIRALAPSALAASELNNVRDVLDRLLIRDAIAALQVEINRSQDDPSIVVREFQHLALDGASSQPAGSLAYAFRHAVERTKLTAFDEYPWALIHQLARRFSAGSPKAAVSLLTGLIDLGEGMSAPSSILSNLRADLASFSPNPLPQADVAESRAPRKRRLVAWAAALPLFAGAALLASYGMGVLPLVHQRTATQDPANGARASELLPPVGKGQRLTREYVRYCKFQEQRLGIVKQHIQAADDMRAYNALVIDYNSRCSDFYYQDEDINAVMVEISANGKMLETDAQRIMATWPWRATSQRPAK